MLGRVCLSCSCFTRNNRRAHAHEEGTEQSHKCADGTWSLRTTGTCVIPAWSRGSYSSFALKTAACLLLARWTEIAPANGNCGGVFWESRVWGWLLNSNMDCVCSSCHLWFTFLGVHLIWGVFLFYGFFEGFSSSALCCYVLPVSFLSPIQLIGLAGTLSLLRPQPPRCTCDTDRSFHCSPW